MTFRIAGRSKEATVTAGTDALTLGDATTGFRTFSSVLANGNACYYMLYAVDSNGNPTGMEPGRCECSR
ncbi:5-enolpyruvylshikimate-3-phosphate synthase [Paraburkholderia sp. UCT70]